MNEMKFDDYIIQNLPEIPPEDIVDDITPWRQAMNRIVAGIALSTITFEFLCMDYILPAIGIVALLLGFRMLKSENKWFYRGYISTFARACYFFIVLILNATIYQKRFFEGVFASILTVVNIFVIIFTIYCLRQGIKSVQQKVDIEVHADSAGALIIWYIVVCVCGMIKIDGMIIVGGVLVAYFFIIRSLNQLSKELDEAGYLIQTSEVRFDDSSVVKFITAFLIVGILCGYMFFGSYSLEWKEKNNTVSAKEVEIKEKLITLGFPEKILDDLTEEELFAYKDSEQLIVDVNEYPINDGREVEEKYQNDRWITTVYDVKELKVTDIAVELSDGKTWVFLHHFMWQDEPEYMGLKGFHGTESIQIWPVYYNNSEGWGKDGKVTGQLLYEKDGVTYSSEYHYIGEQIYTSNDVFFGTQTSNDLFAAFSLPKDGELKRGYIMYQAQELEEGWIASSWFNYTHQMHFFQYPVKTAMENRMESGWNDAGAFKTVQDAFQFYVTEDGVELAGE